MKHNARSACVALSATACLAATGAASAAVIDFGADPAATTATSASIGGGATFSQGSNVPGGFFQRFTAPAGLGSENLVESFTIGVDDTILDFPISIPFTRIFFTQHNLGGYLYALDGSGSITALTPDAATVRTSGDASDRFFDLSFALRGAAGERIPLTGGETYAILITGVGQQNTTTGSIGYFSDIEAVNKPRQGDVAGTFRLTAQDLENPNTGLTELYGAGDGITSAGVLLLVPEPGAAALVAAGSLVMLRRRTA